MSREKNGSSLGVMIIIIGIIILLYNLNILKVTMFWGIVRLWPLLFVVIGLNIILKKVRYMSVITWLLFFGVVIGYSYLYIDEMTWFFGDNMPLESYMTDSVDLDDGHMELEMATGKIVVNSHNQNYIAYEIPEMHMEKANFNDATDRLTLRSEMQNFAFQSSAYYVDVPEQSPWFIDIDGGVLTVELDLADASVTGGKIDYGVGDLDIILPELSDGLLTVNLGIGDVTIDIPENLGVKIISQGGLVSFDTKLEEVSEDVYESSNYNSAEHQLEIQIDVGIGSIEIK